jgi:hypothetical protein
MPGSLRNIQLLLDIRKAISYCILTMNDITNPKFFTAGHAKFTISSPKGEHYTFRIGHKEETQPLFISLMTGPDNENSFTYVGILSAPENRPTCRATSILPVLSKDSQHEIWFTAKSKMNAESTPIKVLRWALAQIIKGNPLPSGYAVQHAGKCCCCGRTLTTPESISSGIGPICAAKAGWGM